MLISFQSFNRLQSFAGFNNMADFDVSRILETSNRTLMTGLLAEANEKIKHETGKDRSAIYARTRQYIASTWPSEEGKD